MDTRIIKNNKTAIELMFLRNALKLNTCIPAIVDEFDVAKQRVSAVPAIKGKHIDEEGVITYYDLPKITNIPLAIQRGNGVLITYPIKKGDVCTLIFSQRSIDNFIIEGNIQKPFEGDNPLTSSVRCMDMTDALCFPGVITDKNTIQNYNNDSVELRSTDGNTKVSVSQNSLKFKQGGASIDLSEGNVTITGGTVTINGKDWDSHIHSGVQPGPGNTGVMV